MCEETKALEVHEKLAIFDRAIKVWETNKCYNGKDALLSEDVKEIVRAYLIIRENVK